MTKKILFISLPVVFSLCCLIISLKTYFTYREEHISAYVASHNLVQRTKIEEKDLQEVMLPKDYVGEDVYLDKDEILGKFVKLSYSLAKGSLIYKSALADNIRDLASTLLKENEANYDLYTSEIKINTGNLSRDMYVDLYLTIGNNDRAYSDLLIRDCRITGLYDHQGKEILSYSNESRVSIVTIAIEKEYVSILNKALMIGNINVVTSYQSYGTDKRSELNSECEIITYLQ